MTTDSTIFAVIQNPDLTLQLAEVQGFRTTGAHGVSHVLAEGFHYLSVPNYYGGDTVIMRASAEDKKSKKSFSELQRIPTDGGGNTEIFHVGERVFLGMAEFNLGIAAIYVLLGGRFVPWQRVEAPGCGAMATLTVPAEAEASSCF